MKRGKRRRTHTFIEKQKALLLALLAVTLLDFVVSAVSMREINRETAGQMQRLAALHMQQVYEEFSRVGYDMRRLLMENQDMAIQAASGDEREQIYAKNNLIDRITYTFGNEEDFHPFFYFSQTKETLAPSWLSMHRAAESGVVDVILERIREEEGQEVDLYHWDYFEHGGNYYMLRAYHYNEVWFICYVPAERIIASLENSYGEENTRVLLLSGDGALLSGEQIKEEWDISEEMLKTGGNRYGFPFTRFQVVREDSDQLDFSIAVVMKGYGGFSRIVAAQALVFFLVLLTLGAFVLMNLYTKRRIIAPVQKFVTGIQSYQEPGGGAELSVSDFHELEQVNEQFRNFVHQIGALKINVYEEKLQQQKLKTDNLKLQLKPHFFLNSLTMVCGLLDAGSTEEAKKLCLAYIRYLRYLFRADMDGVSVREAMEHLEDYLEIMKQRYLDKVETDIYVEEAALSCLVPPLVIQTLVENAFKYAKQPERTLEVSVTVTLEPRQGEKVLCINVSDNGKGFPEEYLALWKQGKELDQSSGGHIGIANIKARLAYAYGDRAQAKFYNSPLGGAAAELHIPMEYKEETEHERSAGG